MPAAVHKLRDMDAVLIGAIAAFAASLLYNGGLVLQAFDARVTDAGQALRAGLLGTLIRRRRWLAGTALGAAGMPLQLIALLFAPLALVQPMLAAGLVPMLFFGWRFLDEPVGRREIAAVAMIVLGVVALVISAPPREVEPSSGAALQIALAILGAAALTPYVWRVSGHLVSGRMATLGAGFAFALSGFTIKLAADGLALHHWTAAAGWIFVTAIAVLTGLLSQMTALQTTPASRVAPVVFVVETAVPVALVTTLGGEHLGSTPGSGALFVIALITVTVAAAVLSSATVATATADPTPDT